MMDDGWYDIAFSIDPEVTVREFAAMLNGLDALDVSINFYDVEFSRDGASIEGRCPEENWDPIVKWCARTEGIEIDWDLMSEWIEDGEAVE